MNQMHELKLENNIKTLAKQNVDLHSVNIGFYFKCGTMYETSKINGITHMCEHMFFRRLNDISQVELYSCMEKIGTTMRAETYTDFVCFDITVSPKYFGDALDIISLLLSDFNWTEEEFKKEAAVVKKQIEFKTMSFSQYVDRKYFSGTKLQLPIMGTQETIDNLTVDQLNSWKKRYFNTNNVVCVLTGAFSDDNYAEFIKKLESIKAFDFSFLDMPKIEPKKFGCRNEKCDEILDTDDEVSDILISFDVDTSIVSMYEARILCCALSEGVGSRLSLVLRENEALTDEVYGEFTSYNDFGKVTIELSVNNYDLAKTLELCLLEILNFKDSFTLNDMQSSIVFLTDNQKFVIDSTSEYNFYLGYHYLMSDKVIKIDEEIREYKNIELNSIIKSCKELFSSSNMIITVTNNKKICGKYRIKRIIKDFRNRL